MTERQLKVLVVDDEEGFRDLLKWEFSSDGMAVDTAGTGAEGVQRLKTTAYDVIVTDITMPELDGLKLLDAAKRISPATEVIVVTGFGAVETAVYAMRRGAFDFVLKPYDLEYLTARVKKAAEAYAVCGSCGREK
jgi:DNA-binding NtrC family response regulator